MTTRLPSRARGTAGGEWIVHFRRPVDPALRLICMPYAGGAASVYRRWQDRLPAWTEVCAVQLPGREQRHGEPMVTEMPKAAAAVAASVLPLADRPLVFFGHSMGAIIAYETARLLARKHGIRLHGLIVSGRRAPQLPATRANAHDLPTPELVAQLRRLNGTPAEVLANEELLEILMPIIRADFQLIETYRQMDTEKIDCPVLALGGHDDPDVSEEALQHWNETTCGDFDMRMFPGDHFFLNTQAPAVCEFLGQRLVAMLTPPAVGNNLNSPW